MSEPYEFVDVHKAPCPICGPSPRDQSESDPTVDILDVPAVLPGATVPMGVTYIASSPVTIIWRVDGRKLREMSDCIPHGWTGVTIRRFAHHGKRVSVEVIDTRGRNVKTETTLRMHVD